jgi:protein arginine kinase activator
MKCNNCHQNDANTHIKRVINGKKEEMYLCEECAKELGVMEDFTSGFSMDSFFGNLLGAGASAFNALTGIERCTNCGSSFNDIVNSGKVGCANCYTRFEEKLNPTIEKLHGRAHHIGKNVTYSVDEEVNDTTKKTSKKEQLKADLENAIKEQRFEDAAKIRDEIKSLSDNKED